MKANGEMVQINHSLASNALVFYLILKVMRPDFVH